MVVSNKKTDSWRVRLSIFISQVEVNVDDIGYDDMRCYSTPAET